MIKFTPKLKAESLFLGTWSKSWLVKKKKKVSANLNQQIMLHTLLALYSTTFHPQMRQIG
jgi:hypothetical protein